MFQNLLIRVIFLTLTLPACSTLLDLMREAPPEDSITRAALQEKTKRSLSTANYLEAQQAKITPESAYALKEGEISLGMVMSEVITSWGKPTEVEKAGNTNLGNQKWIYRGGLSRTHQKDSLKKVYFESGRVVGWEK